MDNSGLTRIFCKEGEAGLGCRSLEGPHRRVRYAQGGVGSQGYFEGIIRGNVLQRYNLEHQMSQGQPGRYLNLTLGDKVVVHEDTSLSRKQGKFARVDHIALLRGGPILVVWPVDKINLPSKIHFPSRVAHKSILARPGDSALR